MYPTDAYPEQLLATAQDRIRELQRDRERRHRRRTRRLQRRATVFAWLGRGPGAAHQGSTSARRAIVAVARRQAMTGTRGTMSSR